MKSMKEINEFFESEMKTFTEKLNDYTTTEQLTEIEKELMAEFDEYDAKITEVKYELPKTVTYSGEDYDQDVIINLIIESLTKGSNEWRVTKGLIMMCEEWRDCEGSVGYRLFDQTINQLSKMTYTGFEECLKATIINELLSPENVGYYEDCGGFILLHNKHNAVLQKMEEIKALEEPMQLNE